MLQNASGDFQHYRTDDRTLLAKIRHFRQPRSWPDLAARRVIGV
jgi:hypothetical protein